MNIRRASAVGLFLIPLAFVTAACGGITRPSGWASPAVDGSTAFIFEDKDRLAALELQDGTATVRWTFPDDQVEGQNDIDLEAVYGQPVLENGSLYLGSYAGDLFELDPETGSVRRNRDIGGNIAGGLAFEGGQFAFATTEGRLFLVNASDFTPADGWDEGGKGFGEGIWTRPVLTADRVFVATMDGYVIALDRANGDEIWRFKASGAIPSITQLDDQRLFAGGLGKGAYILDMASGEEVLQFRADDWVWNTPAFQDGVVYFGDFSGNVYALDITSDSGSAKWVYNGTDKVKAGPVIIDDVLVVADRTPTVHFLRLADGSAINSVELPEGAGDTNADLTVRDGKALVVTKEGRLFEADPASATVREITYGGGQ